jgi:hypothetical protein
MNYDFIEIGTSHFSDSMTAATDDTVGLAVEPIREYLDMLPSPANVTKVCTAIVGDETYQKNPELEIFYIPYTTIQQYNLGWWLAGCNTLGRPHTFHHQAMHLVKREKVQCMTYTMLAEQYNIEQVEYLQTDTEGNDCDVVNGVLDYYVNKQKLHHLPKKIQYESNIHNNAQDLEKLANRLKSLNYTVTILKEDTIAILNA